eukprot:NODE_1600_length_798_cov_97.758569_g1551_i0.p2 GENE.NODE_1600_length_798_cov_97.758569_g1551_i0~~NODE_1600_length_798_cov_97.758569_g1551_i0.p2  ORF type:complete len:213 (-),score=52.13 NODE_1600_length_798_cov_97.758569_g1551_i0:88-726(-)
MQRALIALSCLLAVAYAEVDGGHTVSQYGVGAHPEFGLPVDCVAREAMKSSSKASSLKTCATDFCTCYDGQLLSRTIASSPTNMSQYAAGSLQCITPERWNTYASTLSKYNPNNWNKTCDDLKQCYPAFVSCVANVQPACVQPMIEQCDEALWEGCSEGSICKWGDLPNGLSAGAIFAIAAGILYFFVFLAVVGLCLSGKKKKQPAFEAEVN